MNVFSTLRFWFSHEDHWVQQPELWRLVYLNSWKGITFKRKCGTRFSIFDLELCCTRVAVLANPWPLMLNGITIVRIQEWHVSIESKVDLQ